MVTRKENTPQRIANRKYEKKNKEKRKATSGNFQTMIPRELFEKIIYYGIIIIDFLEVLPIMKKAKILPPPAKLSYPH